jgi:hypothetical protein
MHVHFFAGIAAPGSYVNGTIFGNGNPAQYSALPNGQYDSVGASF